MSNTDTDLSTARPTNKAALLQAYIQNAVADILDVAHLIRIVDLIEQPSTTKQVEEVEEVAQRVRRVNKRNPVAALMRKAMSGSKLIWTPDEMYEAHRHVPGIPSDRAAAVRIFHELFTQSQTNTFFRVGAKEDDRWCLKRRANELYDQTPQAA